MTYEKAYKILATWVGPAFMVLWFVGLFTSEALATVGMTGMLLAILVEYTILAFVLYPREQAKARLYKIYWDAWEDEQSLARAKAFVEKHR